MDIDSQAVYRHEAVRVRSVAKLGSQSTARATSLLHLADSILGEQHGNQEHRKRTSRGRRIIDRHGRQSGARR